MNSPVDAALAVAERVAPWRTKASIARIRWSAESRRLIEAAEASGPLKLHLASGDRRLEGWLNIDREHFDGVVMLDLPSGLARFRDASASFVYCSHMLHYLDYPGEVTAFGLEIRRILEPRGVFRFVVPGVERIIRAYVENDDPFFAEQAKHHLPIYTTKLEHLMCAVSNRLSDGTIKYAYDFETAAKLMRACGFSDVVESQFNESAFEGLRIDYRGKDLSLFVDAVK